MTSFLRWSIPATLITVLVVALSLSTADAAPVKASVTVSALGANKDVATALGAGFTKSTKLTVTATAGAKTAKIATKSDAAGRFTVTVLLPKAYSGSVIVSASDGTHSASGKATVAAAGGSAAAGSTTAAPTTSTAACGGQAPAKTGGGKWQCTWSDEFNATTVSNTWSEIGYGLGEACLSAEKSVVTESGGALHLAAKDGSAVSGCDKKYVGGGIQTQGKFAQQYGRFEMRAKFPTGGGFWPAFWMVPDDQKYDGEIDILESYGGDGDKNASFTLHAPAGGDGPSKKCELASSFSNGFHTYTLEWSKAELKALYDGKVCDDFTKMDNGSPIPAVFDKPYYIILNLAMQTWWPPDSSTKLPSTMDVDYVRAWK